MIKIENLLYSIEDSTILEDINLNIGKGEIVAVVGPNGGGKTTLIKLILGLIKPTTGYITINGKSPEEALKEKFIGYLPQMINFDRQFPISALDVVLFGIIPEKISKEEKINLGLKYIEMVGMKGFESKPFGKLSGGQQQRIMIAKALISKPKLLILDEPSTGVDVVAQESFYELIKKLNKEEGLTILIVSHDIGVVISFAHKVVGLNKKLHYFGPAKDFLTKENLAKLYSSDVSLLIHSDECFTCQHFKLEVKH